MYAEEFSKKWDSKSHLGFGVSITILMGNGRARGASTSGRTNDFSEAKWGKGHLEINKLFFWKDERGP